MIIRKFAAAFVALLSSFMTRAGHIFLSAVLWFFLMALGGAALVTFGVLTLFGAGWSLIAGGVFMMVGAFLLGRGLNA